MKVYRLSFTYMYTRSQYLEFGAENIEEAKKRAEELMAPYNLVEDIELIELGKKII